MEIWLGFGLLRLLCYLKIRFSRFRDRNEQPRLYSTVQGQTWTEKNSMTRSKLQGSHVIFSENIETLNGNFLDHEMEAEHRYSYSSSRLLLELKSFSMTRSKQISCNHNLTVLVLSKQKPLDDEIETAYPPYRPQSENHLKPKSSWWRDRKLIRSVQRYWYSNSLNSKASWFRDKNSCLVPRCSNM